MGNRTGNENDRRQSSRDRRDVRNGERAEEERWTPVDAGAADEIRNARSRKHENEAATPAAPTNQRLASRHVTRTEDHRGRNGGVGLQSSKNESHQPEKVFGSRRQSNGLGDLTTKRKSRDEAELRVEKEIVEAMKREQELRYTRNHKLRHQTLKHHSRPTMYFFLFFHCTMCRV